METREHITDSANCGAQPQLELCGSIGELITRGEVSAPLERVDTFEEIIELERDYEAVAYIRSRYALSELDDRERALAPLLQPMHSVEEIGNQFAKKILPAFLHDDDEEALRLFRSVPAQTSQEEMVLLANDAQFNDIRAGLHAHLEEIAPEMKRTVEERLDPQTGQIAVNDRLQFRGAETRSSLENLLTNGIKITLEDGATEIIGSAAATNGGILPLTEVLKNERIININGFAESKISHVVHDVMDHLWTFKLLREQGFLKDYKDLMGAMGNPHLTNIFLREGEAIGSIAYGVRYWSMEEPGFQPIHNVESLSNKMDKMLLDGELTEERHMRAYKILRQLASDPQSREAQSLSFAFSNYVTELDEQRRKHGKIKQINPETNRVVGELDVFSPDYLSLFVETHHEILQSSNKHRNSLFVLHIIIEEFLNSINEDVIGDNPSIVIKVQDLLNTDVSKTNIDPSKLRWMFRNYGFTSVKDGVY